MASESVFAAVGSGDHERSLRALAGHLAGHLDDCEPRDAASLARALNLTLDRLAELAPPVVAETPLDEMRARREAKTTMEKRIS